ncbi:KamA family radical SAM protein [bacterium]|nr:KamA family radical SAM protein [bacterium]
MINYDQEVSGIHAPPQAGGLGGERALEPPARAVSLERILNLERPALLDLLWQTDRKIQHILLSRASISEARNGLFEYLNDLERHYFNIYSDKKFKDLHDVRKKHAKWCIRVFKNIIRTENEKLSGASALGSLIKLASRTVSRGEPVSRGFILEMLFLFLGINGRFGFYRREKPSALELTAEERPGLARSHLLDSYGKRVREAMARYESGLDGRVRALNEESVRRIAAALGAGPREWNDCCWQMRHIVCRLSDLERLVELTDSERHALAQAERQGLAFQITPYYLSLFQRPGPGATDAALRAQVLPGLHYVEGMRRAAESGQDLDFMGEAATSPQDGITRRYVHVLILKAFNSCPQLCVYCQRNWEVTGLDRSGETRERLEKAIDWVAENENIQEVLVTGGDPLTLGDEYLAWVLERLAAIGHLERIRISTRTPVTLPMRITPELVSLLSRHHELGRREVCVVTHFESPLEMTPAALDAVGRLRSAGLSVYNQEVFTFYNSRRFQTAHLRRVLKRSGVDPYYCFNAKGKDETVDFRVPIARLLQEWTEEARLLPGLARTDTPVFNVPTLGKSYLQSWQDHEIVMLLPDGRRVYRFYPWESMLALTKPYLYTDVSIHDYLTRLAAEGENVNDYHSIWYYF